MADVPPETGPGPAPAAPAGTAGPAAPVPGGDALGARQAGQRRLLKSAFAMTLVTLLSRVLGLVREQVRSYFLGTGAGSDAFGLASTIPNLLRRLFAEGATTAAFVPVFTETMKRESRAELWVFASRFLTLLTIVVTIVTCIGILLSPWLVHTFFAEGFEDVPGKVALTIVLTQVMFPYLTLISIAAVIQGILNSFSIFSPSAFTSVLLNVAIIGCAAALSDVFPDPAYAFATGFLVGGVAQIAFQLPWLRRVGARLRPTHHFWSPRVRRTLRIMAPGVFSAGIYQINVFVSQLVASRLHEGSIAALQYSIRLQELVLGVFVISLTTVILPTLSAQLVDEDHTEARETLRFSLGLLALVTVPATIGLVLLAEPVTRLLFQHGEFDAASTRMTAVALYFHTLGIYPIAVGRVVQQAFFAMEDQRTPMLVGALSMVVNVALCFGLPPLLDPGAAHGGVALAGSVAAAVNALVLVVLLRGRLGRIGARALTRSFARIVFAAAVMGAGVWGLMRAWDFDAATGRLVLALKVVVAAALGVALFLGAARAVRTPELGELRRLVRRKAARLRR